MATVKFKDATLTLLGNEVKVGQTAPDFKVQKSADMSDYTLGSSAGKTRIIATVPSLDTPVCDAQTKRFNEEAAKLPDVNIITVSMDLPFAQKRWCNDFQVDRVKMLSDHKDASFGEHYGTLIKELRIESRAIFVIDRDNKVLHAEYVKEVADHPDYEAALAAARSAASVAA